MGSRIWTRRLEKGRSRNWSTSPVSSNGSSNIYKSGVRSKIRSVSSIGSCNKFRDDTLLKKKSRN